MHKIDPVYEEARKRLWGPDHIVEVPSHKAKYSVDCYGNVKLLESHLRIRNASGFQVVLTSHMIKSIQRKAGYGTEAFFYGLGQEILKISKQVA